MAKPSPRCRQRGFSYLVLIVVVAMFGIGLSVAVPVWSQQIQQDREDELIAAGREIARGLRAYAMLMPGAGSSYPAKLTDLLEDKRGGILRRHLRAIPFDPFTRSDDWGLVTDASGAIRGVHSRDDRQPLRERAPAGVLPKDDGQRYSDWQFLADQPQPR